MLIILFLVRTFMNVAAEITKTICIIVRYYTLERARGGAVG
jgi:hypothetical protein